MRITSELEYNVNFLFLPVPVLNSDLMNSLPEAYLIKTIDQQNTPA